MLFLLSLFLIEANEDKTMTQRCKKEHSPLLNELKLCTEVGPTLSDHRIRLLEAIDEVGSLTKAAKLIGISYRSAWDALDEMNNLSDLPLVLRSVGGKNGGGSQLTAFGHKTVSLYRALQQEYALALKNIQQVLKQPEQTSDWDSDIAGFRRLLRQFSMRSSARNQFMGSVVGLKKGPVDFEVTLRLSNTTQIIAMITKESAESLGILLDQELYALIKSSSVTIVTDKRLKLSARNQIWGTIQAIHTGPINSEVVIDIEGNKSVCAVITTESAEQMQLSVGLEACAAFKASSVLLCSFNG